MTRTQTPGQITQFDPSLTVVDSVITQDSIGTIGIGTTTPAAALDVARGDVNLAGNIRKNGGLFIHNSGFRNTTPPRATLPWVSIRLVARTPPPDTGRLP